MVETSTEILSLQELGELRQRIANGQDYLQIHHDQREPYAAGKTRYLALVADYLHQVNRWRDTHGHADTQRMVYAHRARLQTGWTMEPSDEVPQQRIDETFNRVLSEYQALADVVRPPRDLEQDLTAFLRLLEATAVKDAKQVA